MTAVTKQQLRLSLQLRLKSMSNEDRKKAEVLLNEKLLKLISQLSLKPQTRTWGIYQAHQFEPNLQDLLKGVQEKGFDIRWAYPQVVKSVGVDAPRDLRWLIPGPKGFVKGAFGIYEPSSADSIVVKGSELNGVIVPGLGFDRSGVRLGRGQGYYDRELAQLETKTECKIGVAFQCQLMSELPYEAHDIKMDFVVTDQEVVQL